MKIKYILTLFLLPLFAGYLQAQTLRLTGKVVDEKGEELPGATVVVDGTTNGTVTDLDGRYEIQVESGSTVVFSFVGMQSEKRVVDVEKVLDVKLKLALDVLQDVVIVGYGAQKRENLVGAVSDVSGQIIEQTGVNNVAEALQGTLPGLFTEINSGQPGGEDLKITIRGVSTFGGGSNGNAPLVLVDGVEAAGGFSQINAGDIESITVLKDASSTAIYGVRGANGVILVTTRRGQEGKPTISVSAAVTAKTVVRPPDQLGSYDVLTQGQIAAKNSNAFNELRDNDFVETFNNPNRNLELYPDIDWYEELTRKVGYENNIRVNASGGSKFVKYYASLTYDHIGDILNIENVSPGYDPRFKFDKYGFRSNLDFQLTKTSKLAVDISGRTELQNTPRVTINRGDFENVFSFINRGSPYLVPKYYSAEFLEEFPDPRALNDKGIRLASGGGRLPTQFNPYNRLNHTGYVQNRRDVADIYLTFEQDLDFITKGLKASARFNYSTAFRYGRTFALLSDLWFYDVNTKEWSIAGAANSDYNTRLAGFHPGGNEGYQSSLRNTYYDGRVLYSRSFGGHNVNFTGVFNRRVKRFNVSDIPLYQEDWVGRLTYNFKEKYLVEFSSGYNGTDQFALGNKFGFFPAGAVGWNIANERIVKERLPWLNFFKVRYSLGYSGSSGNPASNRGLYLGGYSEFGSRFSVAEFGINRQPTSLRLAEKQIPNPNATWETAFKQDIGLDMKIFNDKLKVTFDYFREDRSDIFLVAPIASYFHPGFGSNLANGRVNLPLVNRGRVKSQGIEFTTDYAFKITSDLKIDLGLNINAVDNRVIDRADRPFAPQYQKNKGKPIGWIRGFKTNGLLRDHEEAVNAAPVPGGGNQPGWYKYVDFNGNGQIEPNDQIPQEGTGQPLYTFGFNLGVNYKNFNLSARFYGKRDVYTLASFQWWYPNFFGELLEGKSFHLDTWTPDNLDAQYPAYTTGTVGYYGQASDRNLVRTDFLKLQNLSLRYTLNSDFMKEKLRIKSTTFYLTGNNLFVWTKIPFGDPEGGNSISGGDGGSGGNYPLVRRFIARAQITF